MWTEEKLGPNISHKKGLAFKSNWFQNSGVPVIKVTNFTDNSIDINDLIYVNEQIGNEYKDYCLFPGDIVIQTVGSWPNNPQSVVGKVVKVPNKLKYSLLNQNAVIIKPMSHIDSLFLYYLLKSNQFKGYIINTAQGAANQASITLDSIFRFPFYLPPLPIQRKIAAILSAYDELIENNNRRIAILEKMAEEIYREWFVRLRFPGHEKVKVVKGVPEGWEVKSLSEVADVVDCLHTKKPDNTENGFGWLLQLENIGENGRFDSTCRYMIKASDYEEWTKNIEVTEGDCLITNVGRIAAVAQIPPNVKAALGRNMTAVRPKEVPSSFLVQYLLSPHMKNEVQRKQDYGAIMGALNVRAIKKLELILPPQKIMKEFINIVNPIRHSIWNLISKNEKLKSTRDLLLPRLISGKLDVENLDIAFPPGMEEEVK